MDSMICYRLPGLFSESVEDSVIRAVRQVLQKMGALNRLRLCHGNRVNPRKSIVGRVSVSVPTMIPLWSIQ